MPYANPHKGQRRDLVASYVDKGKLRKAESALRKSALLVLNSMLAEGKPQTSLQAAIQILRMVYRHDQNQRRDHSRKGTLRKLRRVRDASQSKVDQYLEDLKKKKQAEAEEEGTPVNGNDQTQQVPA